MVGKKISQNLINLTITSKNVFFSRSVSWQSREESSCCLTEPRQGALWRSCTWRSSLQRFFDAVSCLEARALTCSTQLHFLLLTVTHLAVVCLCPAGGLCEGTPVQHFEGLGPESRWLGPHVPEHLAGRENRPHAG